MKRKELRHLETEYMKAPDENFVGRAKELRDFDRRLKTCSDQPVWCLHGLGGIGKSELLKVLRRAARKKALPSAYVDLSLAFSRSEAGLLGEIAEELGGPEFPSFRKAQDKLRRQEARLPSAAGGLMETGEGLAEGISVATGQPVGAAVKTVRSVASLVSERVRTREPGADPLFDAFLRDLRDYTRYGGRGLPVVLLFDTYDQASEVQEGVIQDLALACCEARLDVLFILAGRDPLDWEEPDRNPVWRREKLIFQQPIQELPRTEAQRYIGQRGIRDPELSARITRFTRGFPLFLRMACDIVRDIRHAKQTPTANEFPEEELDERKVAEFLMGRIIERLPDDRKHLERAIKLLGIPRWFDRSVFALLAGKKPLEADADWREVLGISSLFQRTGVSGRYKYHDRVRDAVLSWWRGLEEDALPHHEALAEWHLGRSGKGKPGVRFDHIREALYHRTACKPLAAVREWSEHCEAALIARRIADLELLLGDAGEYPIGDTDLAPGEVGEMHFLLGYAFNTYPTRRPSVVGEAIAHYQAALRVRTEEDFPQDWAMTTCNLGRAHVLIAAESRSIEDLKEAHRCYLDAARVDKALGALSGEDAPE